MVKEYMHAMRGLRAVRESRPDFTVLVGFEDQILPALLAGADGAICGLSNISPELFVGLVRDFEGGDLAKASRLHRRILPPMAIYTLSDPGLGATKLAMKKLGVPLSPTVRGPGLPAPPGSEEAIEGTLEAAGLLPVQGEA
jgi:dihydrodipicolinate synthase/N-acetylneuraminate lyase